MRKINLIVLHCSATRDGKITPDEWLKECLCFNAKEEYGNL